MMLIDKKFHEWVFRGGEGGISVKYFFRKLLEYFDIPLLDPCCEVASDPENLTNRELTTLLTPLPIGGAYPVVVTEGANVTSSTAAPMRYIRIGNIVIVIGSFTVMPTVDATLTFLELSLPIASDFVTAIDASGSGSAVGTATTSVQVGSSAANDTLTLNFLSSGIGNHQVSFTAIYSIL